MNAQLLKLRYDSGIMLRWEHVDEVARRHKSDASTLVFRSLWTSPCSEKPPQLTAAGKLPCLPASYISPRPHTHTAWASVRVGERSS